MCLVSPATCHLLLAPTAIATDPPPTNSPIVHSRLVAKLNNLIWFQMQKITKTKKKI